MLAPDTASLFARQPPTRAIRDLYQLSEMTGAVIVYSINVRYGTTKLLEVGRLSVIGVLVGGGTLRFRTRCSR